MLAESKEIEIERNVVSYMDKLMGFNGGSLLDQEEQDQMDLELLEDDDETDPERMLEEDKEEEDPFCPIIQITKEEKVEICKPWKLALIVKLLGKRLSMQFLHSRLLKI